MSGGLLHRMYRFRTKRGTFAVKRLSEAIMNYDNVREKFRLSERIAVAVAAAGIPAVTASPSVDGDVLQDIGSDTVMLFPWIDAAALAGPPISAGPERARIIGGILGRIHSLPLSFAELQPPSDAGGSDDTLDADNTEAAEWVPLVEEAERQQLPGAPEVRNLLPQIAASTRSAREARQALLAERGKQPGWVISHSDLDQKNVLWADAQTPYLIDWESAGYVQPAIEAVGAALDWSGQVAGDLNVATFTAFLEGYRKEAPLTPRQLYYGLESYFGNWSGWLKFSLQRAIGVATNDPEEQAIGRSETSRTLVQLRSAADNLPELIRQFTGA